jgi:hypothetical protein
MGQANEDLNLLFRWDWEPPTDDDENVVWQGDENYRDGTLKLFYMGQRKAYCSSHHVEVCRADEPAVREFLEKKWAHMQRLWEGIAASGPAQEETQ